MVITKEILKTINAKNIEWYKSKGYECNLADKVLVKVEDLSIGAKDKIVYKCDLCGDTLERSYNKFASKGNLHHKTYCVTCANELNNKQRGIQYLAKDGIKLCNKCNRALLSDSDHFYLKHDTRDGFVTQCKECMGHKFTDFLTKIPNDGFVFCKKCGRELPHTYVYFPSDKNCKTGLRYVCRECTNKLSGFLKEDYQYPEKWSEEELNLLREVYKDYTNEELVRMFFTHRSIRAIESQASIYGFSFKTEETLLRARSQQGKKVSVKLKGRVISEEHRNKTSEGLRKYYETHKSVRYGVRLTASQIKAISERNVKYGKWKGNKNPRHIKPLNGCLNGNWKGGVTPFYFELRSDTKDWKQDSMELCNYKCVITGSNFNAVHHLIPFRDIVEEAFTSIGLDKRNTVSDYSDEEFKLIRDKLNLLHNKYGLGACLDKRIHNLFHTSYGYHNFTAFNFISFIADLQNGIFDTFLTENNIQLNINQSYLNYIKELYREECLA